MRRLGNSQLKGINALIQYYYSKCPGTAMPFFLLYLAKDDLLEVGDRSKPVTHTSDDYKYSGLAFCQFDMEDAKLLAQTDNAGRHLVERWESAGLIQLSLLLHHDKSDKHLQSIRTLLQKHDDPIITTMQQRQAVFQLAQGLIDIGPEFLTQNYLRVAAMIVEACGLFPGAEDLKISQLEAALLGGFKGKVYYPYARATYLSALLPDGSVLNEFSGSQDPAAKETAALAAAVSDLLVNGSGVKKKQSFKVVDAAFDSMEEGKMFDLVIANRIYRSKYTTSFNKVLSHTLSHLSEKGVFMGLDSARDFFQMTCRQNPYLNETVKTCKLDSIILLPRRYKAVLVVIRNDKTEDAFKLVDLLNASIPDQLLSGRKEMLGAFLRSRTKTTTSADIRKVKASVGEFFRYAIPEAKEQDMALLPLRDLVSRIEKSSSSFGQMGQTFEDLYEVDLDPGDEYDHRNYLIGNRPYNGGGVFEPAYVLDTESIIMKDHGNLEPRIFRGDMGKTIFRDGLAFAVKRNIYGPYIINELRKDYMRDQLRDWYFLNETYSEDAILNNLKIWTPVKWGNTIDARRQEKICDSELNANLLPEGFEVDDQESGKVYRITHFLGEGCFGLTYMVERVGDPDDEPSPFVIKEFFVKMNDMTFRNKDLSVRQDVGTIESYRRGQDFSGEKRRFIEESDRMYNFGFIPDSHVRKSLGVFTSEKTNNLYFLMEYYKNGPLSNLLEGPGTIPEDEATERFIIPLAKALNVLHQNRCVHLDLKPENVLIDDDGLAVLADLGNSKLYDEEGNQLTFGEYASSSDYAAPEENSHTSRKFHPEMDIYSLGAIFYELLTGSTPRFFDPDYLDSPDISDGARKAIISAMELDPDERTSDVMAFVHSLPGHEQDEWVVGVPEYPEEDEDGDSFDVYGDLLNEESDVN